MKPKREKTVSVRITSDEYELLEKLAESQKLDKSDILRSPLVDELNRIRQMGCVA
jgi:uncharacterized protein (DUF1778 family)